MMDRREISLFRRVEDIELFGETIGPAHLQKVSRFASLRTLVLSGTPLEREAVARWQREHPRVKVNFYLRNSVGPEDLAVQ